MNVQELKSSIAELDSAIEDLEDRRGELVEALADLPSETDLWIGPDEQGGYSFKPFDDLRSQLAMGDRAERYYAETHMLLNKTFFTVMDGRPLDEQFVRNFNRAKAGSSFLVNLSFSVPEASDGTLLPGYLVIYLGNLSPYEAREWFETFWSSDQQQQAVIRYAQKRMLNLDRRYGRLTNEEAIARFLHKYPYYNPI